MNYKLKQLNKSGKVIFVSMFTVLFLGSSALAHPHYQEANSQSKPCNYQSQMNNGSNMVVSDNNNQVVPPIESYEEVVATVTPEDGVVNVLLKNETNVAIEYSVTQIS